MDLNLTSDQQLFRAATRKFLEREATTVRIRELTEAKIGFERSYWQTASELGWTSLLVPEEMDGGSISGQPLADLAIVAEEAGQFAAPGPLAVTNAVIAGLLNVEGAKAHAGVIGEIASGAAVATWAVYEPGKGWDPFEPTATATRFEGGFRLNCVKDRVEVGDQADLFLVGARLDGELCQFLVRADAPGVRVDKMWSLDFTRHFATVTFDNVAVPRKALVEDARTAIEYQCQTLFALQCAETCGATARVFDMALEWAFDRYAFGRSLASYQAIKHRFADMKTWLEAMHAITVGAIRSVQDRADTASKISRVASIYVARKSVEIMQDCVQIHGGIGVTWEYDLHIFLRRATVNRALYGTPEEQRSALSALLAY